MKIRSLALAVLLTVPVMALTPGTASAYTTQSENRITVSRLTPDGTYQLFTVKPDGSAPKQLTTSRTHNKCDPAMSPDGLTVAYSHQQSISIVASSGSGVETLLVTVEAGEYVRTPAWSPNGKTIVFMRSSGYDYGKATSHRNSIYAIHYSDDLQQWGAPQPFTPEGVNALAPKFSPMGESLLFSRGANSADNERDLWVMDVASGDLTQVTNMAGDEGMSSWHPRTPGLILFTTCSRGVYTVTVPVRGTVGGASQPAKRVGKLIACDVAWESGVSTASNPRIVTHSGSTVSVYDPATGRSTIVDRNTTNRQPDW